MNQKELSIIEKENTRNFRDLVGKRFSKFEDKVAFKYKQEGEIKEITYGQYIEDIKAIRNSNTKLRNKKNCINRK